jgi:DNA-binding transcriptional regulator GbsR (MarR family)
MMSSSNSELSEHAQKQIKEIHDLLELFTHWFDDVQSMKPEHLQALMKLGSGVGRILDLAGKLTRK